jgi:cytochrome c553
MTTMASKLSKEHLEQIAEYIAKKFPAVRGERKDGGFGQIKS